MIVTKTKLLFNIYLLYAKNNYLKKLLKLQNFTYIVKIEGKNLKMRNTKFKEQNDRVRGKEKS